MKIVSEFRTLSLDKKLDLDISHPPPPSYIALQKLLPGILPSLQFEPLVLPPTLPLPPWLYHHSPHPQRLILHPLMLESLIPSWLLPRPIARLAFDSNSLKFSHFSFLKEHLSVLYVAVIFGISDI